MPLLTPPFRDLFKGFGPLCLGLKGVSRLKQGDKPFFFAMRYEKIRHSPISALFFFLSNYLELVNLIIC
jgi:hypothetical protein